MITFVNSCALPHFLLQRNWRPWTRWRWIDWPAFANHYRSIWIRRERWNAFWAPSDVCQVLYQLTLYFHQIVNLFLHKALCYHWLRKQFDFHWVMKGNYFASKNGCSLLCRTGSSPGFRTRHVQYTRTECEWQAQSLRWKWCSCISLFYSWASCFEQATAHFLKARLAGTQMKNSCMNCQNLICCHAEDYVLYIIHVYVKLCMFVFFLVYIHTLNTK